MGCVLRHQALSILLALLLCGCGAKTSLPRHLAVASLPLKQTQAIALVLGDYHHYQFPPDDPRYGKHRAKLEARLERCLARAAADHAPPIRTIPTPVVKNYLEQVYGFEDFEHAGSSLLPLLQNPRFQEGIARTGLRYLVIADVSTDKQTSIEPILEAQGGSGGGVCMVGVTDAGNRMSRANLQVIDVQNRTSVGSVAIDSQGKQGWMAGVCICIIIPVPYYLPWWAMTETETCEALGDSVIASLALED